MFACFHGQVARPDFQPVQPNAHSGAAARPVGVLGDHAIELADPLPMPVQSQASYRKTKYKALGMVAAYQETDLRNGVCYLNEKQRAQYQLSIHDGRIFNSAGAPLNTADGTNPVGRYLFVMDDHGRVYAGRNQEVRHHSVFMAGNPVAAAGHLGVVDGRITHIDDHSGHYAPPREFSKQIKKEMTSRKVDMTNVQEDNRGYEKKFYKARHFTSDRLYPSTRSGAAEPWVTKKKNY